MFSASQLVEILNRTMGHCHFYADDVAFESYGNAGDHIRISRDGRTRLPESSLVPLASGLDTNTDACLLDGRGALPTERNRKVRSSRPNVMR